MTIKLKKLVPAIAFVLAVMALSSCNRGMGCPNNFSVEDASAAIIDQTPDLADAVVCK